MRFVSSVFRWLKAAPCLFLPAAMTARLGPFEVGQIYALHGEGFSQREIAAGLFPECDDPCRICGKPRAKRSVGSLGSFPEINDPGRICGKPRAKRTVGSFGSFPEFNDPGRISGKPRAKRSVGSLDRFFL